MEATSSSATPLLKLNLNDSPAAPEDAGTKFVLESKGTWLHAGYHLTSATAGTPLLALPYAMAALGWTYGLIALAVAAVISFYTCYMLSLTVEKLELDGKRCLRFWDVALHTIGPTWAYFVVAPLQYLGCFIIVIALILLGGQTLEVNVDKVDIGKVKDILEIPSEERDIYSMLFRESQRFVRQTRSRTRTARITASTSAVGEASSSRSRPRKFSSRRGRAQGTRGRADTVRRTTDDVGIALPDWEEASAESASDDDDQLGTAAVALIAEFGRDESSSWASDLDAEEEEEEDADDDGESGANA